MASIDTTPPATTAETVTSSQDSPMDNPLFFHHGESTSTVLVTQLLIGNDNYPTWARSIRKALLMKNKLGFIDGTLTLSSPLVSTHSTTQV